MKYQIVIELESDLTRPDVIDMVYQFAENIGIRSEFIGVDVEKVDYFTMIDK